MTRFEEQTGCEVNVKIGNTSDEMVQLMQTGEYDGVSASGDATQRLIAGGEVAPVNTDLIPNYADVFEDLKLQPWNSVDGEPYGVPHGRGANLLVCNTDAVNPAPDSWGEMFDADVAAQGQGVGVRLADLHRRRRAVPDGDPARPRHHQPVRARRGAVRRRDRPAQAAARARRPVLVATTPTSRPRSRAATRVAGTTWQVIVNLAEADRRQDRAVKPEEGATGWSDTWMISSQGQANPNCMYMWMDCIISPEANAAVAEWFGEAPSNAKCVRR